MTSSQPPSVAATNPGSTTRTAPGFPPTSLAVFIWGVAAFFYLAAFYLRNSPAVMTTELMRDFGITAVQLGNLSAFYFYAYVLMQIPTGVLVDSWGARRLLAAGSLLAAVGCLVFGTTGSFGMGAVGRAITGGATAVGWVVTLKVATHWFPSKRFATMSGVGLMIGNLGALVAAVPLRILVEQFGWRTVSVSSGVVMIAIGVLAWVVIRDDPSQRGYQSHAPAALRSTGHIPLSQLLAGFKDVFRYRNTWLIFLAQGGIVGGILSFAGLWGVPFLKLRFGIPVTTAAAVCSVMVVCFAVGSPISGYLSDRIGAGSPSTWPASWRSRLAGPCCSSFRDFRSPSSWRWVLRPPSRPAPTCSPSRTPGNRCRPSSWARSPAPSTSATCWGPRCCSRESGGCSTGSGRGRRSTAFASTRPATTSPPSC